MAHLHGLCSDYLKPVGIQPYKNECLAFPCLLLFWILNWFLKCLQVGIWWQWNCGNLMNIFVVFSTEFLLDLLSAKSLAVCTVYYCTWEQTKTWEHGVWGNWLSPTKMAVAPGQRFPRLWLRKRMSCAWFDTETSLDRNFFLCTEHRWSQIDTYLKS